MWESEQEYVLKDDLLLFSPLQLYPKIFHDYVISLQYCENSFRMFLLSIICRTRGIPTLHLNAKRKNVFLPSPRNLSSYLSQNIKCEISRFPSSPLYDSSNNEDAPIHDLEFSDRGRRDLFIHSSDHDSESSIVALSKPSVFDDPYFDELEPPQAIEALQPHLKVMSCALTSVPLLIIDMLNLSRLLIMHMFKINIFYNFHILHMYHTILSLNHWSHV